MAANLIAESPPNEAPAETGGPPSLAESMGRVSAAIEAASDGTPEHASAPAGSQSEQPAPVPTLSAGLDVGAIDDPETLRALLLQAQTLAFRPPIAPATAPAKPEAPAEPPEPAKPRGIFEGYAYQELGEGTPDNLVAAFAQQTSALESARLHLDSNDADYAKAAKAAFDHAGRELVLIKIQADNFHLKQATRAPARQPDPVSASPEVIERAVLAKLARPNLSESLSDLPHLAAAIAAGKYDPAWLAAGIDYSQSLAAINAGITAAAQRANQQYSRFSFSQPAPLPDATAPAGARVGNPAAFAARADEQPPPAAIQGPSSLADSVARVKARIAAQGAN